MKRIAIAIAMLGFIVMPIAEAEDSNNCVAHQWVKQIDNTDGTANHRLKFTNNCGWPVRVLWRANEWDRSMCGKLTDAISWLKPGKSGGGVVFRVSGDVKIQWCADAAESSHSDYNTCPHQTQC